MAHIQLQEDLPGIRGLMVFRPETAEPLNQLADILLRGLNTLSPGERELIATLVSSRNDCFFCQNVHGAVAAHHLGNNEQLVLDVKRDPEHAAVSDKMKALLAIAVPPPDKQANNRDGFVAAIGLTAQRTFRYQGRIRGRNKEKKPAFVAAQSTSGVPWHASRA
jgi:AhpD family alkylhydroperoxidase